MGMIGNNQNGMSGIDSQTIKFSKTTTGTVVASVANKRIYVYAIKHVVSANISTKWRSGASTDLEDNQPYLASGGYIEAVPPPAYLFRTNYGESLDLVVTGTGTASGRISYWIE